MQKFPPAEVLATAIKTACRLTGESPQDVINQKGRSHARHYALHALITLFPGADKEMLATAVGAPENPKTFHKYSTANVFKVMIGGPRKYQRVSMWWDEDVYKQVILETSRVPTDHHV